MQNTAADVGRRVDALVRLDERPHVTLAEHSAGNLRIVPGARGTARYAHEHVLHHLHRCVGNARYGRCRAGRHPVDASGDHATRILAEAVPPLESHHIRDLK